MERSSTPLVVVGGGNIAQAIIRGGIDAGLLSPGLLAVVEPEAGKRDLFRGMGAKTFKASEELPAWLGPIERTHGKAQTLLAIKPQAFAGAAGPLAEALGRGRRVIISILAGMPTAKVREAIPSAAVVRAMPNMASSV